MENVTIENCGCKLRTSFGLPCAHELDFYLKQDLFIPPHVVDEFWRTLEVFKPNQNEEDEDISCGAEVDEFKEIFAKQKPAEKVGMLSKLKGIIFSTTKSVVEPSINKNTRGRPSLKSSKGKQPVQRQFEINDPPRHSEYVYRDPQPQHEPSRHSEYVYRDPQPQHEPTTQSGNSYIPAAFDFNDHPPAYDDYVCQQSASMVNNLFDQDPFMQNLINYQPLQEPIRYSHPLMNEIPLFFQPYVIGIQDVIGDGNCGFRSVAVATGRFEIQWDEVRRELLEELRTIDKQYQTIIDDYKRTECSLDFFGSGLAPPPCWMLMPETGILICNKYNCILNFLSNEGSKTFFPLWSNPRSPEVNQSITIAHVQGIHFVKVDLEEGHPMADISGYNKRSKKNRRKNKSGWVEMYTDRLLAYENSNCNIDLNVVPLE